MTSYEYNLLSIQIDSLNKQVACLSAKITDCCNTTTPVVPDCNGVVITTQPQGSAVASGTNYSLSVIATGDSPLTYQWKKGSSVIQGATSSTYSIINADTNSAGIYSVVVTNPCGSVTSNSVTVSVTTTPQTVLIYSGWTDSSSITLLSQITSLQQSGQFTSGSDISIDYTANSQPKYLVMAEPSTEPLKTKWYENSLNNGNIDTSQDLFPAPTFVSNLRVYITAYPTQQTQGPIVFKIS